MSDVAIRVDNLYKRYRIGLTRGDRARQRRRSIIEDLTNLVGRPIRNFRRLRGLTRFDEDGPEGDVLWALNGISLEVRQGEVLGIVGSNGAGKTTLLRILSRITEPTTGYAQIRGRVGSLLEVGTGFHPELTGRDNVYMNGTILGMRRGEVTAKFEEIVEFAQVGKFIDTPVKRYSTGMQVRLAFAVAAHLEPEILLVDEVLAVGDAEFQNKCLGKMDEVSRSSRTILFVSHNMGMLARLCTRAIWIDKGQIRLAGTPSEIVGAYLSSTGRSEATWTHPPEHCYAAQAQAISARVLTIDNQPSGVVEFDRPFKVEVEYDVIEPSRDSTVFCQLSDSAGNTIWRSVDTDTADTDRHVRGRGRFLYTCTFPGRILRPGRYLLSLGSGGFISATSLHTIKHTTLSYHENVLAFDVSPVGYHLEDNRPGIVTPLLDWEVKRIDEYVAGPAQSDGSARAH